MCHGYSLCWRYDRTMVFCIGVGQNVEGPVVISLYREFQNKLNRYTATLVTCVWAGALKEKVTVGHLGRSSELKTLKNAKKSLKRGSSEQPSDGQMDERSRV